MIRMDKKIVIRNKNKTICKPKNAEDEQKNRQNLILEFFLVFNFFIANLPGERYGI